MNHSEEQIKQIAENYAFFKERVEQIKDFLDKDNVVYGFKLVEALPIISKWECFDGIQLIPVFHPIMIIDREKQKVASIESQNMGKVRQTYNGLDIKTIYLHSLQVVPMHPAESKVQAIIQRSIFYPHDVVDLEKAKHHNI